jgi:hypothetical protein
MTDHVVIFEIVSDCHITMFDQLANQLDFGLTDQTLLTKLTLLDRRR